MNEGWQSGYDEGVDAGRSQRQPEVDALRAALAAAEARLTYWYEADGTVTTHAPEVVVERRKAAARQIAAAEAKLAECRASVKVCDVCGEETSTMDGHALKAALADERRQVADLALALEETRCRCERVTISGVRTALKCARCLALEAHAARRAAEVDRG